MNDTATLSRLFASIETDLAQVDNLFTERATSGLDVLNSASMHALSSPGKRLRTALTLLAGKMNHYRLDKLLSLSVAFEMVHLATLIHDDIIDKASTRRGHPTVNSLWGNQIAILLGDYYFAKTAGLIADIEDFRVDHLFSDTVATVCEGSILELMTTGQANLSLQSYYDKISRKTACLIAACCKGGAIIGGASEDEIEFMNAYGLNLGIAFQIIDDILDYTEDQSTIGKPAGNDLRQGMVTLPLIYAFQKQPQNGHHRLAQKLLNENTHDEQEIRAVIDWVLAGNNTERALQEAYAYTDKARAALAHFPRSEVRDILDEVIDFVVQRKH